MQFVSSRDKSIAMVANLQLIETITFAVVHINNIPHTVFVSSSLKREVYTYRLYSKGASLLTRHAANHLRARIDISDVNTITMSVNDICSTPAKVVKSFRLALLRHSLIHHQLTSILGILQRMN